MLSNLLKLKYNFNPILHNRVILYSFFAIALFDLIYFLNTNDMYSFSLLILIGLLTSFFNKNMIVILFVAIVFTHILKYGKGSYSEGLDNMDSDDVNKDTDEPNKDDDEPNKDESNVDKISNKIQDFSKKIDTMVNNKDDDKHSELIDSLPEIKDTRDKIIGKVKDMQPLLEKFQGYVDKFQDYKKSKMQ
jgi:ABC-type antimicrobial peptide transport system permease subunit